MIWKLNYMIYSQEITVGEDNLKVFGKKETKKKNWGNHLKIYIYISVNARY